MFCTSCGAKIPDDSVFCTSCGARQTQAPQRPSCPACGTPTTEGATFCTSCGASLSETQPTAVLADGRPAPAREDGPLADQELVGADPIARIGTQPIDGGQGPAPLEPGRTVAVPRPVEPQEAPAQTGDSAPTGGKAHAVLWVVLGIAVAALAAGGVYLALTFLTPASPASDDGAQATTPSERDAAADNKTDEAEPSADGSASGDVGDPDDQPSATAPVMTAAEALENDSYLLAESDRRVYSADELSSLGTYDLYVARNEIYARHGREFKNDDLRKHFSQLSWYEPSLSPEEFDASVTLSDTELANIDVITGLEREMGSPWAA